MSVKIINFETWEYEHADAPGGRHGGTLDSATVTYGQNPDGSPNQDIVVVPCPFEACGSVSYWPPGGGADALLGQSLHVVMQYQQPTERGAKSVTDAAAQVKQRVIATDGLERWVLDDAALSALEARVTQHAL
jgi:hypothetical protein